MDLLIDLTSINIATDAFVYDILGRLLLQRKLQGEIIHHITLDISSQILVVYLKNSDGSLSQKLFWPGN